MAAILYEKLRRAFEAFPCKFKQGDLLEIEESLSNTNIAQIALFLERDEERFGFYVFLHGNIVHINEIAWKIHLLLL